MNIEKIIQEITRQQLTRDEWTKINNILSGKRKLVYGDEEITPIFKKINEIESVFAKASSKKEAIEKYIEGEISMYESEINCLEDEIQGYNYKIDELKDILKKI